MAGKRSKGGARVLRAIAKERRIKDARDADLYREINTPQLTKDREDAAKWRKQQAEPKPAALEDYLEGFMHSIAHKGVFFIDTGGDGTTKRATLVMQALGPVLSAHADALPNEAPDRTQERAKLSCVAQALRVMWQNVTERRTVGIASGNARSHDYTDQPPRGAAGR